MRGSDGGGARFSLGNMLVPEGKDNDWFLRLSQGLLLPSAALDLALWPGGLFSVVCSVSILYFMLHT